MCKHRLPGSSDEAQAEFVRRWIQSHMDDSRTIIGKPLLITEFGKSSRSPNFNVGSRDGYFDEIFGDVYKCAMSGGACGGALFWQVMGLGMESWSDGYEVVLENSPSTAEIVSRQSSRISSLNGNKNGRSWIGLVIIKDYVTDWKYKKLYDCISICLRENV